MVTLGIMLGRVLGTLAGKRAEILGGVILIVIGVLIAACLFILAICTAFVAWRGGFPAREEQNLPPMLWITGGFAAQMLLLDTFGFSIATGLLFGATAKGFGRGPLWFTIPLGMVLALAIWIVFAKGLQLSLPAGPIESLF